MASLETASLSRERRLPESNRWKVPEDGLRFVRKSYAARSILERALVERDGSWDCFYCGTRSANSVDHVTCRFKGGSDGIDNLVLACWPCNELKNTKPGWFFVLEQATDLFRGTSARRVERRLPPEAEDPHQQTPHSEHLTAALGERLEQAVSEEPERPRKPERERV